MATTIFALPNRRVGRSSIKVFVTGMKFIGNAITLQNLYLHQEYLHHPG